MNREAEEWAGWWDACKEFRERHAFEDVSEIAHISIDRMDKLIADIQEQAEELRLYREAWEKRCCAISSHGAEVSPPGCLCLACIESRIADAAVRRMREGKESSPNGLFIPNPPSSKGLT